MKEKEKEKEKEIEKEIEIEKEKDLEGSDAFLGHLGALLICSAVFYFVGGDIWYYFREAIQVQGVADIVGIRSNDLVEIGLTPERGDAFTVKTVAGTEYLLVPFEGQTSKLVYCIQAPHIVEGKIDLPDPLQGRVSLRGLDEKWDMGSRSFDFLSAAGKSGWNRIAADSRIVYPSPQEFPGLWQIFIALLALVYVCERFTALWAVLRPAKPTEPPSR